MTSDAAAGGPAPAFNPVRDGVFRSPAAKFFLTGLLTLLLVIPLWMVLALNAERESRRDEVAASIGREWGLAQDIVGPVLIVPYEVRVRTAESGPAVALRHLMVLPETLSAAVEATTETRSLAIYDVPVYAAHAALKGRFAAVDPALFGSDVASIRWDEAILSVAIGDLNGIEAAALVAGGAALAVEPGAADTGSYRMIAGGSASVGAGVHARLGATGPVGPFDFEIDLRLRGTDSLTVAPVGRQSEVTLASNWPHPNFAVGALPSERRIGADGFAATWRVPALARPAPQTWTIEEDGYYRFGGKRLGAGFVEPVDFYALVERALKYGLMFVGATFLTVFALEMLSPHRIHIVQYGLVGGILVMFFVLLLALSERIGFGPAYLTASAATTAVVSGFMGAALESRLRAVVAAFVFAAIFALLYAILRLEDLALLAGSLIGFAVLSGLLFGTRHVDWSGGGAKPPARPASEAAPA